MEHRTTVKTDTQEYMVWGNYLLVNQGSHLSVRRYVSGRLYAVQDLYGIDQMPMALREDDIRTILFYPEKILYLNKTTGQVTEEKYDYILNDHLYLVVRWDFLTNSHHLIAFKTGDYGIIQPQIFETRKTRSKRLEIIDNQILILDDKIYYLDGPDIVVGEMPAEIWSGNVTIYKEDALHVVIQGKIHKLTPENTFVRSPPANPPFFSEDSRIVIDEDLELLRTPVHDRPSLSSPNRHSDRFFFDRINPVPEIVQAVGRVKRQSNGCPQNHVVHLLPDGFLAQKPHASLTRCLRGVTHQDLIDEISREHAQNTASTRHEEVVMEEVD